MKSFCALCFALVLAASISYAGQGDTVPATSEQKAVPGAGNSASQTSNLLAFSFENLFRQNKGSKELLKDDSTVSHASAKDHYTLGMQYLEGKGKAMNCMEAAHCFEQAAKQGMPEAQYQLGMLYEKGKGVPQDYSRAAYWYKLSARQDHVPAQNALGFLYYNGKGVTRDLVISLALFNIAAATGDQDAFQNTYIAASTMSFKSFDKAKALAGDRKRLYKLIGS